MDPNTKLTKEGERLEESLERKVYWKRWGPYLSERQWGTVREDYSLDGTAWEYLPHDHARSRAYRWGEDGIAGLCDRHQYICFALALWNGRDHILKERLFGLSNHEGNHGEDVKEYYFYLDSTPTHSYMKYLYKYPQKAFPYTELVETSRSRTRQDPEYELVDTGVLKEDRYFDVFVEYAKVSHEDILIRIEAHNRGPEAAELHLLPTVWFRNTWSWGHDDRRPKLSRNADRNGASVVLLEQFHYGRRWLLCDGKPQLLLTENETNAMRLWGTPNATPHVKDGINDFVVDGVHDAVNPLEVGTKAAAHYPLTIAAGASTVLRLRLTDHAPVLVPFDETFEQTFATRKQEADAFYERRVPPGPTAEARNVQRQAFAGLLWNKQYYHYDVEEWLDGDKPGAAKPFRRSQRNRDWGHLYNADVISMPDKWEYPWYAAWDLAFHTIPLALVDPDFAKEQLVLMLREWYMHPNGQLPAYEWEFGDVNPPVHAWAAWRVYKIEQRTRGKADKNFLARVFQKLLLNFTWWVNRKDAHGRNIFQGGFLGLDNIGVFDRSRPIPAGGHIEQSDATSWMGMYCLNMLAIAMELARDDRSYADLASKFFEHFVYIAHAMNHMGGDGLSLWDEEDGFYYDVLHFEGGAHQKLKVRSMVGLIPLFAVETLEPEVVDALPGFKRRMQWFIDNRPQFRKHISTITRPDGKVRRLLSIVSQDRLPRVLKVMLDEQEFLSPYGIRSLSRWHKDHPYIMQFEGKEHRVDYQPAESNSGMFGGNSNWRGPVWLPVNFLLVESLQRFHHFFGDAFTVEFPTGSGRQVTLWEAAGEISRRVNHIFLGDESGNRPCNCRFQNHDQDPHWRDLVLFYEYFHGDTGAGLGANHQTGWTGLVAKLLEQSGA